MLDKSGHGGRLTKRRGAKTVKAGRTMCRVKLAAALLLMMHPVVFADVSEFDLSAVPAEGPVLETIRETVEGAFAALQASRDIIRRGDYELTETRIENFGGEDKLAHVVSRNVFDADERLFRMQFEQDKPLPTPTRFTYIEGPDGAFFWDHEGIFTTVNRGYLNAHAYPPIDWASIGLGLYYDHINRGHAGNGLQLMQDTLLQRGQLITASRHDGTIEIDFFFDEHRLSRFRLVLDESRDFVPIQLETIVFDRSINAWRNDQLSVAEWSRIDDHWVPQELKSSVVTPHRELSLSFRWLSVNKQLSAALFDRDSFDLPDGTYIADNTLRDNETTLVEVIGESGEALLHADAPADGGRTFGRWILILVNIAVAVMIAGGLCIRWAIGRRS